MLAHPKNMSLLFALVLIAIAWMMSGVVDTLPHIGVSLSGITGWLACLLLVAILAWGMSDP